MQTKTCLACNKLFIPSHVRVKSCSYVCGRKAMKRYFGEDNPSKRPEVRKKISEKLKGRRITWENPARFKPGKEHVYWKGGLTQQKFLRLGHGSWKKTASKARERDNFECQDCGISEQKTGRKLAVHHIVPHRISKNDSLENLVSLCNRCHRLREVELLGAV